LPVVVAADILQTKIVITYQYLAICSDAAQERKTLLGTFFPV
jgi:hypothetical protein